MENNNNNKPIIDEHNFKPTGAMAFFIALLVLFVVLWFIVYFIAIYRIQ